MRAIKACIITLLLSFFASTTTHGQDHEYTRFVHRRPAGSLDIWKTFSELMPGCSNTSPFDASYAILIGISNYPHLGPLDSPLKDIKKLKKFLLGEGGFNEVIVLTDGDATQKAISYFMEDYFPDLLAKSENSRFLFYFSGHGDTRWKGESNERGYLRLLNNKKGRYSDSIGMDQVQQWALNMRYAKHALFLVDTCMSGLAGVERKVSQPSSPAACELIRQSGSYLITAGRADELALGGKQWGGSLFTEALLGGIESGNADGNRDGIITTFELYSHVKSVVSQQSKEKQHPIIHNLGEVARDSGELFFLGPLGRRPQTVPSQIAKAEKKGTEEDADKFIADAESELQRLSIAATRAQWAQSNFVTDDTNLIAIEANEKLQTRASELARQSFRFMDASQTPENKRKLQLIRRSLVVPTSSEPQSASELTGIIGEMESLYGNGQYCPTSSECFNLSEMNRLMAESRDPKQLLQIWKGWHAVFPPMRNDFIRSVHLANNGAKELGFSDLRSLWNERYDMPPTAFEAAVDNTWIQVKPLYESLHCYVRSRLAKTYGEDLVPLNQAIPAYLLGDMWAQDWSNIYPLLLTPELGPELDLTAILRNRKIDAKQMVRYGELFYTSLGFSPLPATFWERSLFSQPQGRDVVCHPSAWNIDYADDLRLKMCAQVTGEDFLTIHHELGHSFYQRTYNRQPFLFQDSANDGFHEGLADAMALSVTPEYLKSIDLLGKNAVEQNDITTLLHKALEKIAFMPFALLVDKWRGGVFSGEIDPSSYNKTWWYLKEKYQGVRSPESRGEDYFDPGAKYHVAGYVPYTRYYLASIFQFQFHRALCKAAGYKGQLHRCTIYGSREAGQLLQQMMSLGASRPWPEALETLTGQREMDASALVEYFAPLKAWLDQQNQGQRCGW